MSRSLKIAFLNRGRDAFPGGDCIQLDATMDALRQRGHYCEETGWNRDRMRAGEFDLAHILHCNFSWSYGNYEAVRDVGLPYVLTPIYYPGPLLSGITKENLGEIIDGASCLLPFSETEMRHISTEVSPVMEKTPLIRIIPNATDQSFHWTHVPMRRSAVMAVSARGDSDKNIPTLRRICQQSGIPLTVVSGVSRTDLATMYPEHAVFVNASGSERMSLTIGEALCAGCRVLATDQNWGNSYYPGIVTFDPTDELYLEHLVRWALSSEQWDYRPNAAARCLTWSWVAEKLEDVYRKVLE